MKKLITVILILTLVFAICGCEKSGSVSYDIESDINYVKDMFKCVDIETLTKNFSKEIKSPENLEFEGTFACIDGTYEIRLYEEGDNAMHEAGEIYQIRFSWDYTQEVPIKDVAEAMTNYLGEAGYKDEEWDKYYWLATEMDGITKFSNAPFGNCFDVDIYGSDCCICFGLSTTSYSSN